MGLESGFYQVIVAVPGFKTFEQKRIDLASAQIKRVDARLEVGNVDTRITVEGAASQVETETATLSNIKTGRDFAELPLSVFGRGWANVTNVAAGVQSTSGFEVKERAIPPITSLPTASRTTTSSAAAIPQTAFPANRKFSGDQDPHGELFG